MIALVSHQEEVGWDESMLRSQIDRADRIDDAGALRQIVVLEAGIVVHSKRRELQDRFHSVRAQCGVPGNAARFASSTSAALPDTTAAAMLVPLSRR